jgi:DNA polymerase III delta prime subunit
MHTSIPWVEKYRPSVFEDIVIDEINHTIFHNMIDKDSFPNMLLYGPPGTGKTTTIINLIHRYQEKYNQLNKGLMIHLNASDERGIDIIRNQIHQFVNSQSLFSNGLKIVVLDEVDYMTKNAQQALKYLVQEFVHNVRFCLICNYISRIDESLQNEFIHLRFNCLPPNKIVEFLAKITKNENLSVSNETLYSVQRLFKSDIRSMVNYLQSHHMGVLNCIDDATWERLIRSIMIGKISAEKELRDIENTFQMNLTNIIKGFLTYILFYKRNVINSKFLNFCEIIFHLQDMNIEYLKNYFLENITEWITMI